MSKKRKYTNYSPEFKDEAVTLVTEQGCSIADAAKALDIHPNLIYKWRQISEIGENQCLTSLSIACEDR